MLTFKLLFLAVCFLGVALVSLRAAAAPNDLRIPQENLSGGLTTIRSLPAPAASATGVLTYDGSTQRPQISTMGPSLTITGGVMDVVGGAGQVNADWASSSGVSEILNKPVLGNAAGITASALGLALMTATLPADARSLVGAGTSSFSGAYADLAGIPATFAPSAHTHTMAEVQALTTTIASLTATNAALASSITLKLTTPTGSSTTQYVSGDGSLQTLPVVAPRSFATITLAVGSVTQVSTTRDAQVAYPVDVSVSSLLLGTAQGTICLRYADNVGMSTNLVTVMCGTNSTNGVLNVVNIGTVTLNGIIPAGKFRRLDFTTNAGTATGTSRQGQEVLL